MSSQPQSQQQDPDALATLGGWLFRQRSWIPLPIVLALLLVPASRPSSALLFWIGAAMTASGEAVRLWAVRHIGVVSRTRSDRLGGLVSTGPFALVRNPLYLGNVALWTGFAVSARLLWLAPAIVVLLAVEYHAIVRWEERLLDSRFGDGYRSYAARVPRWIPGIGSLKSEVSSLKSEVSSLKFSWGDTLFSERGTLLAIAIGYLLLSVKGTIYR